MEEGCRGLDGNAGGVGDALGRIGAVSRGTLGNSP
jgi:hypothetical protein